MPNYTRSRSHASDYFSAESNEYRIYFDPELGRYDQELIGGVICNYHPTYPGFRLGTILDSKSKGRWTYNDCTNISFKGEYGGIGSSEGSLHIHSGPDRVGSCLIGYPSAGVIIYSDAYGPSLAETALNPQKVHTYAPTETIDYIDADKLATREVIFSDKSIPRELDISMDPLDTDFSIWFLITDIVQLKGLWKGLIGSKSKLFDLRGLAAADELTAKQLADDHLAVSFGLLPTIQDFQQFFKIIKTWTDMYDKLEKDAVRKRYWRRRPPADLRRFVQTRQFDGSTTISSHEVSNYGISTVCKTRVQRALHHSTASFSYLCPEFHGFLARLRQFVDAFGILDPAAIWDAIPFSFLVDWFLGIGNWLHKNRPRAFPCDVVIHDYCESVSLNVYHLWYASYWATGQTLSDPVFLENHYLGSETHSTYLRRVFRPPPEAVVLPKVKTEIINVRRALISASLIAQRLPR